MNELCEKYGDKLVILAFPTNQFGHQENSSGQEIINALKYVRPGNGFQPKCIMFDKVSNFFYNSFHSTGLRDNDLVFWLNRISNFEFRVYEYSQFLKPILMKTTTNKNSF